jgi:hypothetical protein
MFNLNPAIVVTEEALFQQFAIIRENQLATQNYLSSVFDPKDNSRLGLIGLNRLILPAKVAINSGNLVSIVNNAGVANFDLALAGSKPTHGYCFKAAGAGASCQVVLFDGVITTTGLTVGTKYYTSTTTAGNRTSTAGATDDCIGIAISTTQLLFHTRGIF